MTSFSVSWHGTYAGRIKAPTECNRDAVPSLLCWDSHSVRKQDLTQLGPDTGISALLFLRSVTIGIGRVKDTMLPDDSS